MSASGVGLIGRVLGYTTYTKRMQRIHGLAGEEAERLGTHLIGPEHYLLALVGQSDCAGAWVLKHLAISLDDLRQQVLREVRPGPGAGGQEMQLSPGGRRLLDCAFDEARQLNDGHLGTEHLLLALLREKDDLTGRVLVKRGADWERVARRVLDLNYLREGGRLPARTLEKMEAEMGADLEEVRRQARAVWEGENQEGRWDSRHENPQTHGAVRTNLVMMG
jgi:ATP-dependent Clp protease ATP-binding subunit ClpC